ncbi:receptor-type tyrosine-protein phosphatase kappa-like [Mya arenaria]|uniref:receptor-type tyrosine-protein phosphatase kappa-like n=1 Tax=Mya arenaria TaxID=6604 RepID=UPI0022E494C6|nr:receptor-type tyrosine-protein phosphatase kappa-like [Mya arenaria]
MECNNTCENSMCDINGNCTNGCITNTFGKHCENTCDEHCTPNENKTICSEKTGMCFYGCQTEYKGRFCPQIIETEAGKQNWPIAALGVGIAGGVVVLAAIVVVELFFLRRRRVNLKIKSKANEKEPENLLEMYPNMNNGRTTRAKNPKGDTDNFHSVTVIGIPNYQSPPTRSGNERTPILTEDNLEIDEDDASAKETAVIFEDNGGFYYNNAEEISKIKLHVTDLPEYVHNLCFKDLEEEFQNIPYGLVKAYGVSQTKLNMHKNRYRGIYPYDDTRVLVRGGETDYINASFIDGFRRRNAYIATLGPMVKQLGDFGQFWQMVWQQKVEKIVMLTNLVEGTKTKCEQYWPDFYQRKMFGDIKVVCNDEKLYADFIWRHFTLYKKSKKRSLHHLQYTSWPDKDITSFIEFRQRVNALSNTFDGPVVVHCSAGVGRTGTYIALDILTTEGQTEGAIDIPGCVGNMRQNRPNMIQTLSQYKFIHQALVHTLTTDCVYIRREHFSQYMDKSRKQEIQEQFEKMQSDHEQKSDKELLATEKNRLLAKKYRKHTDIPGDSSRPHLNLLMKTDESEICDIDSFKTKKRFLVAKTPLPDTVYDFIALAVQENCSCIVSMEASMEKNKTKTDVTIPHFQYLNWDTKHNVPKSPKSFVAFIKEVEAVSKSSNLSGPILLHCLNGAGKSGLFCVVLILLEQLDEYDEVSVVNAVKKIRARRPLAIPNKEQFYFCYECVLHSVNETDKAVYYNLRGDIQRK